MSMSLGLLLLLLNRKKDTLTALFIFWYISRDFVQNPDMMEMPFPTVNMTRGELACVADTARDLDLDVKIHGSDVSIYKQWNINN